MTTTTTREAIASKNCEMPYIVRLKYKEQGTLCKSMYDEGKSGGWPGLGEEVSKICADIGIEDVNNVNVNTKVIKEAIFNHHYADMKTELKQAVPSSGEAGAS